MNGKRNPDAKVYDVALWGDTQVGKTTALASYICQARRPQWVQFDDPVASASLKVLEEIWATLRRNRPPGATAKADSYEFWHEPRQCRIRFLDMRGGDATSGEQAALDTLQSVHGVIIFIPWPTAGNVNHLIAAERALRRFGGERPAALAITKTEHHLSLDDFRQFTVGDPIAEAQRHGLSPQFIELLSLLPRQACFPISVYGYRKDGYPAHYYDEFGTLVAWGVAPVNVTPAFDFVVERLP